MRCERPAIRRPFLSLGRIARNARCALLAAGLAWAGPAVAAVSDGFPPIFGTRESQSATLSLFPKWQGAVTRTIDESRLADEPCESGIFNRCHLREWMAFIRENRGRDRRAQIDAVNSYMNDKRYIIDPVNWGIPDYWASPLQFMMRNGDCEDYAIAKYFSLRALGFHPSSLRVVVLQDMNLRVAHAILVVNFGGQALVLDNQVRSVVEASAIHHYRPIYSINEQYWWLHRM
jgi:predicted transglutaminase-like cysteine proteinase